MTARILSIICCVEGLLAAGYLSWALHRSSESVMIFDERQWPRPSPYPDAWLLRWHDRLEATHPVAADGINIHREWPRLQLYLSGWIGLALLAAICGGTALLILRRRRRDAEQDAQA